MRPLIKDPITLKRIARFKEHKRALWALRILLLLYVVSLGAELICNDKPLYVRFEGRSYFPVLRFYPESTFVAGGKETRPDYKALRFSPSFSHTSGNTIVFAAVPYGPLENISPESLQTEAHVDVQIARIPHVGTVNVREDLTIARASQVDHFFTVPGRELRGQALDDMWPLSPAFRDALASRFRNTESGAIGELVAPTRGATTPPTLSLSTYKVRSKRPSTVRITFREQVPASAEANHLRFSTDLTMTPRNSKLWSDLGDDQRASIRDLARRAFDEPVDPVPLLIEGRQYDLSVRLKSIAWPHPPIRGHWLGIDSAGRDVLARVLYGLRISMTFGLLLVVFSMIVGVLIGATQGYYGGKVDLIGQRATEIWSALPFLYVIILLGSVYGRSFMLLLVCYGIFNWVGISYYMRAEFLRLRKQSFADAAKCLGVRPARIILRHILPNAITPVITFLPFSLVGAIGSLAALDYLGFGLPPPTPSWGELLHQAQTFRWAWWLILYPSLALFIVMLLGVFIGEGVRDAYDPRRFSRMR